LNLEIMEEIIAGYEEIRVLTEEERNVLFIATGYAASMLAFHRFFRHVVRYPNPEKFNFFGEQMRFSNNVYKLDINSDL
ncbi:MAG: hypothetical protein MK214_17875, partial [Thalassotalea sp.]|nr:hypothetical protein [Thalassotalea sp.]